MSTAPTEKIPLPLLQAMESRILPWQQQWGMDRCLVAPFDLENPRLLNKWLATGATIEDKPFKGKRVFVKGPRKYGNRSLMIAQWPEDELESRRTAMIGYVLSGQADIQLGERLIRCLAGHSLILLPGVPFPHGHHSHLLREQLHGTPCEILWISGGTDFGIGCWICHFDGQQHFERSAERCYVSDPTAVNFYEALVTEAAQPRGPHREICNHLFQALLLALSRDIDVGRVFQFTHQRFSAHEAGHANKFEDPIPAVKEYVKYNLHLPLHIDDVARQFFLSRTPFTQRFKKETGQSFHDYLTEVRLDEAKRLLSTTNWSISMIERAVGFNSSRMRVLFNRDFGLSPQQFRKENASVSGSEKPPKRTRNPDSEKVRPRRRKAE